MTWKYPLSLERTEILKYKLNIFYKRIQFWNHDKKSLVPFAIRTLLVTSKASISLLKLTLLRRVIDQKFIALCNFDQIQSSKTQPHLMAVMSEMKVVTPI